MTDDYESPDPIKVTKATIVFHHDNTDSPWICYECGTKYGTEKAGICTLHSGVCGWCGKTKTVSHYRNYGYPTNSYQIQLN